MRPFVPRPFLFVLTLVLVAGAIAFIELRLDATGPVSADPAQSPDPPAPQGKAKAGPTTVEKTPGSVAGKQEEGAAPRPGREAED